VNLKKGILSLLKMNVIPPLWKIREVADKV